MYAEEADELEQGEGKWAGKLSRILPLCEQDGSDEVDGKWQETVREKLTKEGEDHERSKQMKAKT
jgi:hypothetical protein